MIIKTKNVCKLVQDIDILKHLSFFTKPSKKKIINEKNQKKYRKLWSTLFLVINLFILVIVLWTQLKSDGGIKPLDDAIRKNINLYYVLLGLVCFLVCVTLETLLYDLLLKSFSNHRNLSLAYKGYAMGKYYDLITPFSIGGKPFIVYYFSKRGLKASQSISTIGARYVANTISFCLLAVFVMCGGFANAILVNSATTANLIFAKTMAWIGFSANVLLILFIILVSVSKRIMQKLLIGLVWFLKKLHLVKKTDLLYMKILRTLLSYQHSMKQFFTTKSTAFIALAMKALNNLAQYSIPYFVFCAFNGFDVSLWFAFVSAGIMIDLAACCLPVPGGSGVAEMSFTAFFGGMFLSGTTFWALLIWRFLSYYLYILQGGAVMIYDFAHSNKKHQNQKAIIKN